MKAGRVTRCGDVRELSAFRTGFHLLDAHVPGKPGGTGERFDWELARAHPGRPPLVLSGGLTLRTSPRRSPSPSRSLWMSRRAWRPSPASRTTKVRNFFEAVEAAAVQA